MINWRHESIAKNVNGTTCPTCRSVVTGDESLPNAEKANGPKKASSVWGNPDLKAAQAKRFVGSTLTLEQERTQEAIARQRYREEIQRKQHELSGQTNAVTPRVQNHLMAPLDTPTKVRDDENQPVSFTHKLFPDTFLSSLNNTNNTLQASPSFSELDFLSESSKQSLTDSSSSSLPLPAGLLEIMESFGNAGEFQKRQMEKFIQKTPKPPPGFERMVKASSSSSLNMDNSPLSTNSNAKLPENTEVFNRLFGQPSVQSPVMDNSELQRAVESITSNGNQVKEDSKAPTVSKSVPDQDSDAESTPEERAKKEEKRKAKLAQKKAKEDAIAKSKQRSLEKSDQDSRFHGLSPLEYAQACEAAKKLEQERADLILAQKLAKEDETSQPPPPPKLEQPKNGRWYCHLCTYENEPLYPLCAMCSTRQPSRCTTINGRRSKKFKTNSCGYTSNGTRSAFVPQRGS